MKTKPTIRTQRITKAIAITCLTAFSAMSAMSAMVATSQNATAQDTHVWTNTTSTNAFFDINGNWNNNDTPGAGDFAIFNANAFYDVHWDAITGDRTPSATC